jgi:hypothetical protein
MAHGLQLTDRARDLQPQHLARGPQHPGMGSDQSRWTAASGIPPTSWSGGTATRNRWTLSRARNAQVSFAVTRNFQSAVDAAQQRAQLRDSRIADFSLLGLPIQTQNMYRVLLMVPLGAMIIVLLRNVVGVQTFGTFMPVLIALSFRETELLGGVILFTLIVSLGLAIRFYLEHLKLLLVPRLAAVVIVVVLLMLAEHRQSSPRHRARPRSRPVPDGDPGNDHRAHVHHLGGTRRLRTPSARAWEHGRRDRRLSADDQPAHRAPDLRVSGTAADRAGRHPAAGPLHWLSSVRIDPLPRPRRQAPT